MASDQARKFLTVLSCKVFIEQSVKHCTKSARKSFIMSKIYCSLYMSLLSSVVVDQGKLVVCRSDNYSQYVDVQYKHPVNS